MDKKPVLGIIGGLGPCASAYFYDMICSHTKASCDQEHIDLLLTSFSSTPDRTAFLVGESAENPLIKVCDAAKKLEIIGADFLVITCNTTHCFIKEIRESVNIPVLSIIEETVSQLKAEGCRKCGIMATDGTVKTELYQNELQKNEIEPVVPEKEYQKKVMSLIYDDVKSGRKPQMKNYMAVCEHLINMGCDRIILGCTELSVVNKESKKLSYICDAMEVLAYKSIIKCRGVPKDFSFSESI